MLAEIPDRNERVELVAAALCDAEFFPGAWEFTEQLQREVYRREALELLVKLDAWAAVQIVDLAGVLSIEEGLSAIVDSADTESPRG